MISKQKRGQITIFVILGIVLLIVAGGFLYMRSQAIDDQGQQEVDELTPQEFGHVKKFVDTCVYEIAKEGLMIIGEKGGYVNPLQSGVMAVPGFPTKGNGFEFAPQTNLLIPYWYYMSSADSCVTNCDFESKQPMLSGNSVNSIESQLRRYVANNINNCLKDFEDFKEQGLDIERSEKVDVIIIIGDESIVITLDNSLTIKQDDQLVTISKFTAELDVKLKQMYELATQIVNYESSNNTKFLEMFTREVIALGSMGSDKKIPPMRGLPQINLKGSDYWLLPDVKSELENQLMMNIPTLQLLFSRNSAIFETGDPYIDATYNMRIISLDPEVADPLMINQFKTNFVYLGWWPIYLKVKPGSQVIRPEVLGWRTSRFSLGISLFDFAYDVSYPVMVVLEDEQAFKGEGFTLQFGLETNLRNNHPISSLPLQFEIEQEDEVMIDFCGLEQRNSGDITINTKDVLSEKPVKDVILSYHCFEETCLLGESTTTTNDASLTTKLPICLGGYFFASKEGYMPSYVSFSTNLDVEGNVDIEMIPEKSFKISVKKHLLQKLQGEWNLMESYSALDDSETLLILFEKVIGEGEEEYIQYVSVEGLNSDNISLVPGIYTVEAILMRELGPGKSPENIILAAEGDFPETIINESFLEGGLHFDTDNTFEITLDDYEYEKMNFHVVGLDPFSVSAMEDLAQMDAYEKYSVSKRELLKPEFE